jgi:hypothetical protein
MTCSEWTVELVECARRQANPHPELRAHLSVCLACTERWDAESQLSEQLGIVRAQTAGLRSPEMRRESLVRDFARARNLYRMPRRKRVQSWVWGLSAAAALLLAGFVGHETGLRSRRAVSHGIRANGAAEQTAIYETSLSLSKDASALSSDDFIAIPYTPPLAPGEIVRMVHTDLSPDELASMGVAVDPSWANDLQADMVVGEDGLPRAVRITETGQQ